MKFTYNKKSIRWLAIEIKQEKITDYSLLWCLKNKFTPKILLPLTPFKFFGYYL